MLVGSASSQDSIGNIPPSDYTPPGSISSRNSIPRADSDEFPAPPPVTLINSSTPKVNGRVRYNGGSNF